MCAWTTYSGLAAPMCVVCCSTSPVPPTCACALLVPPLDIHAPFYEDYDAATEAISDFSTNCIGFILNIPKEAIASFTADNSVPDSLTLTIDSEESGLFQAQGSAMFSSINLKSGSTLSISFELDSVFTGESGTISYNFFLYKCDGTLVFASDDYEEISNNISGSFDVPIDDDGEYIIIAENDFGGPDTGDVLSLVGETVMLSDDTMTVNPVIALWDDSGTTRQLLACPRLLIPPQTSDTGFDVYADEATAQDAIDNFTSNCVGYIVDDLVDSFDATDGGSSLTLSGASSGPALDMWGSVNMLEGDVLSTNYSVSTTISGDNVAVQATIYYQDGTEIEHINSSDTPDSDSGTLSFSAAPISGMYFVRCECFSTVDVTGSHVLTSDGILTINPITALYAGDPDTNCPSRLDCEPAP